MSYYLLMTSLPLLEWPLAPKARPPISRLNLTHRLALVGSEERGALKELETLLSWRQWSRHDAESDWLYIEENQRRIEKLRPAALKNIAEQFAVIRGIIAAMRLRARGQSPSFPISMAAKGYTQWMMMIRRNWHEKDFYLGGLFPELVQVDEMITAGEALALERWLLRYHWNLLDRFNAGHYFDFVALAVYLLKWELVDGWLANNQFVAQKRFQLLVEQATTQTIERIKADD